MNLYMSMQHTDLLVEFSFVILKFLFYLYCLILSRHFLNRPFFAHIFGFISSNFIISLVCCSFLLLFGLFILLDCVFLIF